MLFRLVQPLLFLLFLLFPKLTLVSGSVWARLVSQHFELHVIQELSGGFEALQGMPGRQALVQVATTCTAVALELRIVQEGVGGLAKGARGLTKEEGAVKDAVVRVIELGKSGLVGGLMMQVGGVSFTGA